ncbi:MAG TPA: peroxide stress protein YaaA [Micromonosporaceae bacterium]
MLILLPPSEGKTAGGRGRPLDLANLSFPELAAARGRVLAALVEECRTDPVEAAMMLGLGPTQADEVVRNSALPTAPTRPAIDLYTGVLYDALDFATLGSTGKSLLRRSAVIFSGLWGAVRLGDRIPAYRLSIGVNLPGLGGLGAYWRSEMSTSMAAAAGGGLVIDLRSGAYRTMWAPANVAGIRVLHERTAAGVTTRTVVSHFNKATKGRILRDLAQAGARPRNPTQLAGALRDLKYTVETTDRPGQLDVVVAEL